MHSESGVAFTMEFKKSFICLWTPCDFMTGSKLLMTYSSCLGLDKLRLKARSHLLHLPLFQSF